MANDYRNRARIVGRDPMLGEALDDVLSRVNNVAQQVNANPTGKPPAPPQIGALQVTGDGGGFHATITDGTPVSRGVEYHLEYSTTPTFAQPHGFSLGPWRTHRGWVGAQNLYWRAYSQYPSGQASKPVYHGSAVDPLVVNHGGASPGPPIPASTGSGTASTDGRQGGAGYGFIQQRGAPVQG